MYIQTKLSPNGSTTLILKAQGPRRGALGLGDPVLSLAAQLHGLGTVTPAVGPRPEQNDPTPTELRQR